MTHVILRLITLKTIHKVKQWQRIKFQNGQILATNNLDVGGINIADDMPPSFVNDAMREMMAQIRQWQSGLYEEPLTIKGDLDLQGGMTLNGQGWNFWSILNE